jgi:hypothetical protein
MAKITKRLKWTNFFLQRNWTNREIFEFELNFLPSRLNSKRFRSSSNLEFFIDFRLNLDQFIKNQTTIKIKQPFSEKGRSKSKNIRIWVHFFILQVKLKKIHIITKLRIFLRTLTWNRSKPSKIVTQFKWTSFFDRNVTNWKSSRLSSIFYFTY